LPTYNNQQGQYNMTKLEIVSSEQMKPQDVDKSHPLDLKNFPHNYYSERSKKYILQNTIENLEYFLKYHRIKTVLNTMNHEIEIDMNKDCPDGAGTDDKMSMITNMLNIAGHERKFTIEKWARGIALKNQYHPVKQWILSRELQTTGNIEKLCAAIPSSNTALTNVLIKRWLISAVAAVFENKGVKSQGVLVLCGAQYAGKTTFIENLCDETLDAILLGHTIDTSDKDTIIRAAKHWIVELGELDATFRKSDIAKLKSYIVLKTDKFRVPYGATDTRQPRRTVFAASVNDEKFLVDDTGNRRFWTIQLTGLIDDKHGIDMQQLWREVYALYEKGEGWYLTRPEFDLLNESNKKHETENPMRELILQTYQWGLTPSYKKTLTQIMDDFDIKPSSAQFNNHKRALSKALRDLKVEEFKSGSLSGFIMPIIRPNGRVID